MDEIIRLSRPFHKQIQFFKSLKKYICYGGARGGGKSWAMRTKCILLALHYPGIQILLLRRTYKDLQENHIKVLQAMFYKSKVAKYNDKNKELVFINGSRIKLGYCDHEKDVLQYQGLAYEVICLEEATLFTEQQFVALTGSLRPSGFCKKEVKLRMYFTCNPGGVGHAWVKRLFIDKDYRDSEDPDEYEFIDAKVYDNEFIMKHDPGYVKTLENMPENMRKAMLEGNWDVFDGQYFKEFDRSIHVIDPFEIPDSWKVYFTMDYGLDMLAAYWIAVNEQGEAYVIREISESDLIVSEAAELIKKNTNEKIYQYLAPPDMWNRRQETGKSVAELFNEAGISLSKTSNDRIHGWMAMKEWFKVFDKRIEDGNIIKSTSIKIFSNCNYLIKCIPLLQFDDKRINDVSTEPHDITHGPDAIRGFCVNRISPSKPVVMNKPPNFDLEKPKIKPGGQGKRSKVI